ncbi:MAG: ABC transporter ATP-binding protein, partial [Nitrospirae bacterium]|nr:ABC transporter ATP-binding protein [Nitrospirota bacterium]
MWSIFTSAELRTLWGYLHNKLIQTLAILGLSFLLAFIEGGKAVALIGLIKSLVATDKDMKTLLTFTVFKHHFDFTGFQVFSTRMGLMGFMFVVVLVMTILTAVITLTNVWLSSIVQLSLKRDVRESMIKKVFSFDIEYFNQARSGDILFLQQAETNRFSNLIQMFIELITFCIQSIIYFVMLFYLFWGLTIIVLISAIIFFILHSKIDSKMKYFGGQLSITESNLFHFVHQIIYGIKMIKIGGLEQRELFQFLKEHDKQEKFAIKMGVLIGVSRVSQDIGISLLMFTAVLFLNTFIDLKTLLSNPGQFLAYLFLLMRSLSAAGGLQRARTAIFSAYAPLSRVMKLLNQPDGPDKDKINEDESKKQHLYLKKLSLQNVSFGYSEDKKTLNNVTIDFEAGKLNALVGFSGSGKSTLLDILSIIRRPNIGLINLDDNLLDNNNLTNYRYSIGYMNQDPIIFHESVRTNIKYYKPNATDEDIWKALDMAAASEFVRKMPNGLDTGLGERGVTISGGERQRIGLARVFLQDAPILLLDEATNALDYATEYQVYFNLKKSHSNKIIIMAAHRLSAIKDFDKIIVMRNGNIAEIGTHDQLMEIKGFYYALYIIQNQFAGNE